MMRIDAQRVVLGLDEGSAVAAMEREGHDALWIGDASHDPFLACLVALQHSTHMAVGTGIAVAFAVESQVVV